MTLSEDDFDHYDYDREDRLDISTTINDMAIYNFVKESPVNLERLAGRIKLDGDYCDPINNPKLDKNRGQKADKANRAVTEQVLDARTRMILLKMINNGVIYEINGCISTGKEANVYHAETEDGEHRAIKIYKSTILTFKARDKYVSGEFRFRTGYSKSNPRKMVQVWAEKEMRNLKRLNQAGVPSPVPLLLKAPVLVMDFIGDKKGVAAPRLKDAYVPEDVLPKLYDQLLRIVRNLYQECHLVHADLSEYNLLYKNQAVIVIDVSQSVEREHMHALEFLRQDCTNVLHYFRQRGLKTLSLQKFFDFVTDSSIIDIETWLGEAHTAPADESTDALSTEKVAEEAHRNAMTEESVFRNTYIPRSIEEVINVERLVKNRERGGTDDIFTKLTGLIEKVELESCDDEQDPENSDSDVDNTSDYGSDDSCSDSELTNSEFGDDRKNPIDKEALKALKKENKKKVKEEKREKRKTKIKKHVKKKATKSSR
jgi:RIO kinase 1